MPPQIALLICIALILLLLWMDRKNTEGVSRAVWIPLIWMLIAGSRFVSFWLNLRAPVGPTDIDIEGSPLDRAIFLFLMLAAAIILMRRRVNWGKFVSQNKWLLLFFFFAWASMLWSDNSLVSFKRWIKALGNVIMVLVILTEQRPYEAIGVVLRRFAILFLPLSVLFIKYYPHLGRLYHMGIPTFTGVSDHKNGLGQICLVSGIYFAWDLLLNRRKTGEVRQVHVLNSIFLLSLVIWLLYKANSATSLSCLIIAVLIFLIGRHPAVAASPRKALAVGITCTVLLLISELLFGLSDTLIAMLGRRPDLTNRIPMWKDLMGMVENPVIGFGYGAFWLGDRKFLLADRWGVSGQAHNGYLQVYLDLGIIGILILAGWILSGLKKAVSHLTTNYSEAILRFCFIVVVAFYNWTEATFYGVSLMWSIFLLGIIDVSVAAETKRQAFLDDNW